MYSKCSSFYLIASIMASTHILLLMMKRPINCVQQVSCCRVTREITDTHDFDISMKKEMLNLWNLMVHMMILFSGVNVTVFLANSLKIP